MTEEWKSIKNYEGFYEVSTFGRVRSVDRIVLGNKNSKYIRHGNIMSAYAGSKGHRRITLRNGLFSKKYLVHRLVYVAFCGELDDSLDIDHINHDPADNRPSNLRQVTRRVNSHNRMDHGKSKYVGVYKHTLDRWRAQIYADGKHIHLGIYNSEMEASMAYQNALLTI